MDKRFKFSQKGKMIRLGLLSFLWLLGCGDVFDDGTLNQIEVPVCSEGTAIFDEGGTNGFARLPIINPLSGGPTDMAFVPGSSDFIVATQDGALHYFNGGCDAQNSINVTEIGLPVVSGGEQGLLNIEFHPDWISNNLVFVYHTSNSDPVNSVSRLELTIVDTNLVLANPVRVIDFIKTSSAGNHNGGGLVFAPDKSLLASVGDGGNGSNGQTTGDLLGAVIRISPALSGNAAYDYSIPTGNMFAATGQKCFATSASATDCPELLAIGLRNPYRMSIDGNIIYLGEVGTGFEEINSFNYTDNTVNFGWSTQDGPGDGAGFTNPILSYERSQQPAVSYRLDDPECGPCSAEAASIMIGPVYRGSRYGGILNSSLIWSEYYQGYVRSLNVTAAGIATGSQLHLVHQTGTDVLVTGPDGYIYLASLGSGFVHRLIMP